MDIIKIANGLEKMNCVRGVMNLPGDKSLAHRVLILCAISNATTPIKIYNFPHSKVCLQMVKCLRKLGVVIKFENGYVISHGQLSKPKSNLDAGTSATTLRLLIGLLAAQSFSSKIKVNGSLRYRPMKRVIEPLTKMGAYIKRYGNVFKIKPRQLIGCTHNLTIPSAQVKSAIILSGLYAKGKTVVNEFIPTRDHTEHMLNHFGYSIIKNGNRIEMLNSQIKNGNRSEMLNSQSSFPNDIHLPGDISSAAFFIVLAIINPRSHLLLNNILINATRFGLVNALQMMGADIKLNNVREMYPGEKFADIEIKSSQLKSIEVSREMTVSMIDEIPIFIVAAMFAKGVTVIKNAGELRFKESNRINSIMSEFSKFGAKIKVVNDDIIIEGADSYPNIEIDCNSHNDHRIAMSLIVLSKILNVKLNLHGTLCIKDSFPDFMEYIQLFDLH